MELKKATMEDIKRPRKHASYSSRKDVISLLNEFVASGEDIVQVEFSSREYVSPISARSSFDKAVKRCGYNVKVVSYDYKLYLIRIKA